MIKAWLYCGVALAGLVPAGALAQETSPSTPAAQAAPAPDTGIPDIIVQAQRRNESLQSVPIAITVLSSADLAKSGATDIQDLNRMAPGLSVQPTTGFLLPRIRGVGTTIVGPGLENSVAVYIDGVYFASSPSSLMGLNNIAQVAVLKGPQGTLFGRNATGGLIQITTRDPSHQASGDLEVGYGNYDTFTGSAYLTGGLSNTLAADLAVRVSTQGDGYGTNLVTGSDVYRTKLDLSLRSKWLFEPGPNTTIRLTGDYSRRKGSMGSTSRAAPGTVPLFGPNFNGSPWDINADYDPHDSYEGGGVSLAIDQRLGWAKLSSITAYRRSAFLTGFDADGTATFGQIIDGINLTEKQFSQELQLQSDGTSKVQWVGGLYYFQSNDRNDPANLLFNPLIFPIQSSSNLSGQKVRAFAAYAQATVEIADRTHLTLGGRYTSERHSMDSTTYTVLANGFALPPDVAPNASKTWSKPTWRVALDHQFADGTLLYASYNRGFKSGGFNAARPQDPAFDPEVLDAYEVGIKSELADHRVRLNIAGFYYNYRNIQVGFYSQGQIGYYNGAGAEVYGVDADLQAVITPRLSLNAGVSLLHDRFTSFPNALFQNQNPFGGTIASVQSAAGNRLPLTPDATFNVGLSYRIVAASGTWEINGQYYYNDGYFSQPDNLLRQGSYSNLGGSLGWTSPDKHYRVSVWGKNLTNKAVAVAILSSDIGSLASYAPPRTFGVTLGVGF